MQFFPPADNDSGLYYALIAYLIDISKTDSTVNKYCLQCKVKRRPQPIL